MEKVKVNFYGSLNKLLPPKKRYKTIQEQLRDTRSIKDLIESMGIPHTEVGKILMNGRSTPISFRLQGKEVLYIYPAFRDIEDPSADITPPPMSKMFILDVHLGTLAKYMRGLGIDTLYENYYSDEEIVDISLREGRTILTRDRGILKRRSVEYGYLIKSNKSREQLREVFINFDLSSVIQPFSRCMKCNGLLKTVDKMDISHELDPLTKRYYTDFFRCSSCKTLYWKGGHWERMSLFIDEFLNELVPH